MFVPMLYENRFKVSNQAKAPTKAYVALKENQMKKQNRSNPFQRKRTLRI